MNDVIKPGWGLVWDVLVNHLDDSLISVIRGFVGNYDKHREFTGICAKIGTSEYPMTYFEFKKFIEITDVTRVLPLPVCHSYVSPLEMRIHVDDDIYIDVKNLYGSFYRSLCLRSLIPCLQKAEDNAVICSEERYNYVYWIYNEDIVEWLFPRDEEKYILITIH